MKPEDFLKAVKEGSEKAVALGKKQATSYFRSVTGASKEEAEAFYVTVRAACSDLSIVANMSQDDFISFLDSGSLVVELPEDKEAREYALKRREFSNKLGIEGIATYASITSRNSGDQRFGPVGVSLLGVTEQVACLSGDVLRFSDPTRSDYVSDPKTAFYSWDDVADCKAASSILRMPPQRLLQGTASLLKELLEGTEYGRVEGFVFSPVAKKNFGEVVVPSEEQAMSLQASFAQMAVFVPMSIRKIDGENSVTLHSGEKPEPQKASSPMRHLAAGDRVVTKPFASSTRREGQILDVSNGLVTVQWDDDSRSMFGLVEAMSRLMPGPKEPKVSDPERGYVLDGMDDRTAKLLSGFGHDPVSLYSVVSHWRPASPSATEWLRPMMERIEGLGIKTSITKGFKETDEGELAFLPHSWLEARLPDRCRLVIDVGFDRLAIVAGEAEEYVKPLSGPTPIWA